MQTRLQTSPQGILLGLLSVTTVAIAFGEAPNAADTPPAFVGTLKR